MPKGSNLAEKIDVAANEPSAIEPAIRRPSLSLMGKTVDSLDELHFRKPLRQHVYEFGQVLAIIGLLVACYISFKHGSLANVGAITITSLFLVALCKYAPRMMLPVWRSWMVLGMFLGTIVTGLLLGLIWVLMFIPMSLLLRVLRIKVMDMSYGTDVKSYWLDIPAAKANFKLLERQY